MPQLQHEFCTVPNCGRPHKARGYCQAHYQHFKRGVPIKEAIRPRDQQRHDHCTAEACKREVKAHGLCHMHYARFLRHGSTDYRERQKSEKPCAHPGCTSFLYAKGLCQKHYVRNRDAKKKYGITGGQYYAMVAAQDGVCAVCSQPPSKKNRHSGKVQELVVDHCHETGVVRSLLCDRCNRAIGLLKDSPDVLRRAALYLEFHQP